jgi:hypothetical protein
MITVEIIQARPGQGVKRSVALHAPIGSARRAHRNSSPPPRLAFIRRPHNPNASVQVAVRFSGRSITPQRPTPVQGLQRRPSQRPYRPGQRLGQRAGLQISSFHPDYRGEAGRTVFSAARPRGEPNGPDLAYHGPDQFRSAEYAGKAQQARREGPVQAVRRRLGADAEGEVEGSGAAGRVCLGGTLDVAR